MSPQGQQCPFCQLIANPEQLLVVGETDNFYAWLEINPRAKGHANIVPKEHKESVMDFTPGEYEEAMMLVRRTLEKAFNGLRADGASVTMNIKEAGGQMLPHAYIQVFPRFEEDENAGTPTGAIFPQREDLQNDLEDIKESMASATVNFEEETREAHPDSQKHSQRSSGGGFSSNLVDREQVKKKSGSSSEKDREEKNGQEKKKEPGRDQETKDSTEEKEDTEKESHGSDETTEDRDEPEGEGHWDGKTFEWR